MDSINRRRYERVAFFADLEIRESDTGRSCRGRSFDLSRGGIGFFSPRFLPVGTRARLTVYVRRQDRLVAAQVEGVVVRATAESGGAIVGAAFTQELSPSGQPLLCECLDAR